MTDRSGRALTFTQGVSALDLLLAKYAITTPLTIRPTESKPPSIPSIPFEQVVTKYGHMDITCLNYKKHLHSFSCFAFIPERLALSVRARCRRRDLLQLRTTLFRLTSQIGGTSQAAVSPAVSHSEEHTEKRISSYPYQLLLFYSLIFGAPTLTVTAVIFVDNGRPSIMPMLFPVHVLLPL